MGRILQGVQAWLDSSGWDYQWDEEGEYFTLAAEIQEIAYPIAWSAQEEEEWVFCHIYAPQVVPGERMMAAVEFITRANYAMPIGNFELDMEDGLVRYKVSVDVKERDVTERVLVEMQNHAIANMCGYFPGLMAVCFSDIPPAAAVERVESGDMELYEDEADEEGDE